MRPKMDNKYNVRFERKKSFFHAPKKHAPPQFFHRGGAKSTYLSFFLTQPVSISSRKTVAMTVSRMMPTRDQRQA